MARELWPSTSALFGRAGLSPGMRCIDIGCGGGAVTLEMARLVAPGGGSVTGADMDEVKLGLARREAQGRGLANAEFRQLDAGDWDEPGTYDAVYCRTLLQHPSQPLDLLRRMWAAVRPGGVLMVEDADFDGWCCHPPNDAHRAAGRCCPQGRSGAPQSDVCGQVCCPAWCWFRSLASAASSAASAARPWAVMRTQVRGRRPV